MGLTLHHFIFKWEQLNLVHGLLGHPQLDLVVFSTLKLWRYHSEENMRVSMAIARERLVKNAASIATATNGGGRGDGDGPSSSLPKDNAKTNLRNGGNSTTSSSRGKDKEGNDPAIHSI
jgi:hypothetical protein